MRRLREEKPVEGSSKMIKLKPVIKEDKVMRVGGRISMAPISTDAMDPMILPTGHHICTILVRHIHEVNGHCGVEQVLSLVWEHFWIVKESRVSIKKILRRCISLQETDGTQDESTNASCRRYD